MLTFDPLDIAFRTGQELYKAGLIAMINTRRQTRGRAPVAWPEVAATPAEERWREGNARLWRYRHATPARAKTPVLLVCSLINRPYVLDLLPERSVVQQLLAGGHDVWLLDWGTPTAADATRPLADYALAQLPRAAAVCAREAGADGVHVLGYCMGGTLSLMASAAGALPAVTVVAMATPIELHDDGLLSLWCRTPGFDPVELAEAYGNVPPHVLQPAFKMLDPVALATKFLHLDEKVEDDEFVRFFLAMETWLEDSVAFPGGAFVDWVRLYRSNALARGELVLGGKTIDLAQLRCPLFNIVAEGDYITPAASSLALQKLAGSTEHELVRMNGGHIGLSTGRAAHERLWPAVSAWLHAHDAPAQSRIVVRDATAQKDSVKPAAPSANATPATKATSSANATPTARATPPANARPSAKATASVKATPTAKATPSVNAAPPAKATPSVNATPTAKATGAVAPPKPTRDDRKMPPAARKAVKPKGPQPKVKR